MTPMQSVLIELREMLYNTAMHIIERNGFKIDIHYDTCEDWQVYFPDTPTLFDLIDCDASDASDASEATVEEWLESDTSKPQSQEDFNRMQYRLHHKLKEPLRK